VQPSEYEGGHAHTAKAMVGIYCASNDYTEAYIEAYRAFRCAPKKVGEQDEEKLFEVVSRRENLWPIVRSICANTPRMRKA
jgi:hypothetical protein